MHPRYPTKGHMYCMFHTRLFYCKLYALLLRPGELQTELLFLSDGTLYEFRTLMWRIAFLESMKL